MYTGTLPSWRDEEISARGLNYNSISRTKTDDQGNFSFEVPKGDNYFFEIQRMKNDKIENYGPFDFESKLKDDIQFNQISVHDIRESKKFLKCFQTSTLKFPEAQVILNFDTKNEKIQKIQKNILFDGIVNQIIKEPQPEIKFKPMKTETGWVTGNFDVLEATGKSSTHKMEKEKTEKFEFTIQDQNSSEVETTYTLYRNGKIIRPSDNSEGNYFFLLKKE